MRNLSKTADPTLLFLWAEAYGVGRRGAHGTLGESWGKLRAPSDQRLEVAASLESTWPKA